MSITIEKGIPVPKIRQPRGHIYPVLQAMKPGDSFMVESDTERQNALMAGKRLGLKVVSRKISGEGIRIWMSGELPRGGQ